MPNQKKEVNKNQFEPFFSDFWRENLNLIEDTWQTQPNVRDVRFYAKSSLAKKPDRVKIKYSVKVTHKNEDQTQTKKVCVSKTET